MIVIKMGAGQTTLNKAIETITGTSKIESITSEDLMKKNTAYENSIQILDSIFTDMAFSTYIPSHANDATLNIENDGCKLLHEKLKTLFMNIPEEVIERIETDRLNPISTTDKSNESLNKSSPNKGDTCDRLADFYVTTYLTIQDILRALSPHYVYKEENGDTIYKTFPVYEEKNKSFAEELTNKNKSIDVTDMNPCKRRMLMFHYNSNKEGTTFEFGIRNPFDKRFDIDHLNYGLDALRDLYKDKYNPVTKRFESSTNEMKDLMYLQMKDLDEKNIQFGKLISIDTSIEGNEEKDETITNIREKYNQYVKSVYDIRTHYDSSIKSLHTFIMNLVQTVRIPDPNNPQQSSTETDKKTIRKTMTYEDILVYRKEVTAIIRDLYEKCDELSMNAMATYDSLYQEIEMKTSEYKLNNLNRQIEEFMTVTSNLGKNSTSNSNEDRSGDMMKIRATDITNNTKPSTT